MPVQMWPLAARHFCLAWNTGGSVGESPYEKRFQAPFKGQRLPFGCLVDFMPSDARKEPAHKFSNPAEPGVLVGYHQHPGGRWSGDYLVYRLSDLAKPFAEFTPNMPIHRTCEVFHVAGKPCVFPLKARHEAERSVLGAELESSGRGENSWDVPATEADPPTLAQGTDAEAPGGGPTDAQQGEEDVSSMPVEVDIEKSDPGDGYACGRAATGLHVLSRPACAETQILEAS